MGLGVYPEVSIRAARLKALELREQVDNGEDPLEMRKAEEARATFASVIPTFAEAAELLYGEKKASFRNAKHSAQWIDTLAQYVFPQIGSRLVDTLKASDFADVLRPIWLTKPETASRIKQRCDATMQWCAAHDYVVASPVQVIDKLLPNQPGKRERTTHHPAVPWREVPQVFDSVLEAGVMTQAKLALQLLILTAARSGEVRGMEWSELDLTKQIWTVPAIRMKAKVAHRVPLSTPALRILETVAGQSNQTGLVFPSRTGTVISDMAFTKLLRDHKVASDVPDRFATAHGFRSSFRDWASESGYGRELAERALAHTIKSSTEAAYHRTDLLELRREMMEEWGNWCARSN
jgi:integrase